MKSIFFTSDELAEIRARPTHHGWAADLLERLRATIERDPTRPTDYYETVQPYGEARSYGRQARDIALVYTVAGDEVQLPRMVASFRREFRLDAMDQALDATPPKGTGELNARQVKNWRPAQWSYGLHRSGFLYAYDLTGDHEVWRTDQLGERLEQRFAEVLAIQKPMLARGRVASNQDAWYMATCAILGALLGDREAVELAIEGPLGFKSRIGQLVEGRFWPEPITYGHHYVKDALTIVAEVARHTGREDLYGWQTDEGTSLKSMYEGFLELLLADGRMPGHGDSSGTTDIAAHVPEADRFTTWFGPPDRLWGWPRNRDANTFEIAYRRYGDPRFAWVLAQSPKRDTWDHEFWGYSALTHGVELGERQAPSARSHVWRRFGAALVRGDEEATYWRDQSTAVYLRKCDRQGHGDSDSANLLLHAHGRLLYPDRQIKWDYQGRKDPRTGGNLNEGRYSKRLIAHNTVSIDCGEPKHPYLSELGAVCRTGPMKAVTLMDGDARLRRTIGVTPEYVLDWTCVGKVVGPEERIEHTFDYHLHGLGLPELSSVGEIWSYTTLNEEYGLGPIDARSEAPDNQWIRPGQTAHVDRDWRAVMREETPLDPAEPRGVMIHVLGASGTQVITGNTPDYVGMEGWDATRGDGDEADVGRLGLLLIRRRATDTEFVVVHQPFRGEDVEPFRVRRTGDDEIEVHGPGFRDRIRLTMLTCERETATE